MQIIAVPQSTIVTRAYAKDLRSNKLRIVVVRASVHLFKV